LYKFNIFRDNMLHTINAVEYFINYFRIIKILYI